MIDMDISRAVIDDLTPIGGLTSACLSLPLRDWLVGEAIYRP
jgi:hypothetical protein